MSTYLFLLQDMSYITMATTAVRIRILLNQWQALSTAIQYLRCKLTCTQWLNYSVIGGGAFSVATEMSDGSGLVITEHQC